MIRRFLISFGKFILFFAVWVSAISIPLSLWNTPEFLEQHPAWLRLYWELVPLLITAAITFVFIKYIDKDRVRLIFSVHWIRDSALGMVTSIIWICTIVLILFAMGVISVGNESSIPMFWVYALSLLINTITQELLVRGYPFSMIENKHGVVTATVSTTILFLLMHGGAFEVGIIAVCNVICASILLSLLRIYTKAIWATIVSHFIWNLIAGLVLGAIVLGDDIHIYTTSIYGGEIVSGGVAGIEGGVTTLAVTSLLIGIFYIVIRKDRAKNRSAKTALRHLPTNNTARNTPIENATIPNDSRANV